MTSPAAAVYQPKSSAPAYFHFTDEMVAIAWSIRGGLFVEVGSWLSRPALGLDFGPRRTADF